MSDSKPDAPLMLGVSGLRGIVGESLTPEVAMRYAGAFGAWLGGTDAAEDHERPDVVVARDGRANGPEVYEAAIEGLLRAGCNVKAAGIQMTPSVGVAVHNCLAAEAGVVVTASHNPQQWNGLKLLHDGAAPSASTANDIIERFRSDADFIATSRGKREAYSSLPDLHLVDVGDELKHRLGFTGNKSFQVVVDSVNSSGVESVRRFFEEELPAKLVQLHGDNSGIFPHTPEPTAENLSGEGGLCDAVSGLKADIGFAQDPDGDRLAIVDEAGRYIGEEYTLALCAVSILEAHLHAPPSPKGELSARPTEGVSFESEKTPSDPAAAGPPPPSATGEDVVVLCANLSTSRMIDDIAARYGASVVRTAVGEANVVEAMKRLKREGKTVLLGGEGNGGVIWPEVTYVRDSLGSMALVLSLMARTGKTVSQLVADIPSYAIVKRKQPLANKADAQPAIERIAAHYQSERIDTQDGVRVDFDEKKAWVHVRASNTEPILRLIAEAANEATADAILDEVAKLVGS